MLHAGARRHEAHYILLIAQRELKDVLRDWRLVLPILALTLLFPVLMSGVAYLGVNFVNRYGASLVMERIIPFLLMVVGFFPLSFSLVIALESFVGEKERGSMEPLLATPVSDRALYIGKLLAAVFPPLMAGYFSIALYVLGLTATHNLPENLPAVLIVQIILLTALEALVMVAGAVVISAHTTSVRAANLLASFIIVPMAVVVQAESAVMFWGRYDALWWIALGLLVLTILLVHVGLQLFQRETLLARGMDRLILPVLWRTFVRRLFSHGEEGARFSLRRLYREDIPRLLRQNLLPMGFVAGGLCLALGAGIVLARQFPPSSDLFVVSPVPPDALREMPALGILPSFTTSAVWWHNVRALLLALLAGLITLGVGPTLFLMIPIGMIGYLAAGLAQTGGDVLRFLVAFILPHGIVEIPAAFIATAFAVRVGTALIAPEPNGYAGQKVAESLADFVKVFLFVTIPMLLLAAFLEVNVTPLVVSWLYG